VFSGKPKIGLSIVIEPPVFPASGTVTSLTFITQPATMFIFLSMTGDTGYRRILEGFGTMTFFTFHFYMLA